MKYLKSIESELFVGNSTGVAGTPSIPFNKGYYQSGNSNTSGINFSPSEEYTIKSYKKSIRNKKKKKMKKLLKEDATLGNTGGMGNVVSAIPSSTPGDVAGSIPGSGDIGQGLGTFTNIATFKKFNKTKNKKIKKYKEFKKKK